MKHIRILLSAIMVLLLCACDPQPELCFVHDSHRLPIDVVFDWSLAPDAQPKTMSLYLFPDNGDPSLRYEFNGCSGGRIMVPTGRYTAIAINSDGENVRINNTHSLELFEIRLRDAYELEGLSIRSGDVPRAPGAEDERMATPSTDLWRARCDDVVVEENAGSKLVLQPEDAVFHYSITITSVTNLASVQSVSATASGMAGSMFIHDVSLSNENVTVSFDISPSDPTTLKGQWMTFGHCGHSRSRTPQFSREVLHQFTVYAVLADGSKWYQTYDITDQIHTSETGDCDIVLDGLELPDALQGGSSGFNIGFTDWTTVSEQIPM